MVTQLGYQKLKALNDFEKIFEDRDPGREARSP